MDPVKIGALGASFENVMLPMGLMISHLIVQGSSATIHTKPLKIELQTPGKVEAHITEAALAAFLEKESPGGMKNISISALNGKIHLNATVKMLFEFKAEAICTLRIVDGKQLYVDLESVEMAGVGAKNLAEQQIEKI
ncbi:MAG: hypothetical protein ABL962_09580, partial [Fimbriimonadaceae bacterium]